MKKYFTSVSVKGKLITVLFTWLQYCPACPDEYRGSKACPEFVEGSKYQNIAGDEK